MVKAKKLLLFSALALGIAIPAQAQAQQGAANSRRTDSGCIRLEKAISYMFSLISGNDDKCRAAPRGEALSSRSQRGKAINDVRVVQASVGQIN